MSDCECVSNKITLVEALQELAYARNIAELNAQNVNAAQKALEATPQWLALQDAKKAEAGAREDLQMWDRMVRQLAHEEYRATGNTEPAPGVTLTMDPFVNISPDLSRYLGPNSDDHADDVEGEQ